MSSKSSLFEQDEHVFASETSSVPRVLVARQLRLNDLFQFLIFVISQLSTQLSTADFSRLSCRRKTDRSGGGGEAEACARARTAIHLARPGERSIRRAEMQIRGGWLYRSGSLLIRIRAAWFIPAARGNWVAECFSAGKTGLSIQRFDGARVHVCTRGPTALALRAVNCRSHKN